MCVSEARAAAKWQEPQRCSSYQGTRAHRECDELEIVACLKEVSGSDRGDHGARPPDPDRKPGTGCADVRRKCDGQDTVYPNDAGVRKKAGRRANERQLREVGLSESEYRDH